MLRTITETSPVDGEDDGAVTRERLIRFSHHFGNATIVDERKLFAQFDGQQLGGGIPISPHRPTVTLFYENSLLASALIRVTLVGMFC